MSWGRSRLTVAGAVVACCTVLGPGSAAHGAMGAMPPPGWVSTVTFRPLPASRQTGCEQRLERAHGNGKLAIVGASFTAGVGAGDPGRSWAVLLARTRRGHGTELARAAAGLAAARTGRRRRIRVPPPGAGSARTVPPWRSATWRTMDRPRPEPGTPRAEGAR